MDEQDVEREGGHEGEIELDVDESAMEGTLMMLMLTLMRMAVVERMVDDADDSYCRHYHSYHHYYDCDPYDHDRHRHHQHDEYYSCRPPPPLHPARCRFP